MGQSTKERSNEIRRSDCKQRLLTMHGLDHNAGETRQRGTRQEEEQKKGHDGRSEKDKGGLSVYAPRISGMIRNGSPAN